MRFSFFVWEENGHWWGFSPETHIVYGEKHEWHTLPSEERKRLLEQKMRERFSAALRNGLSVSNVGRCEWSSEEVHP